MIWFRSLIYLIFFYTLTPLSLGVYILLLIFPRTVMQRAVGLWSRLMILGLKVICGCGMEFRGLENIPDGPVIFASKHQSAWETFIFYLLYDDPAYVLKKELMSIPIWGWLAVRADHIPVDRQGGASALREMIRSAKKKLAAGRPVVIFPEGTRAAPGEDRHYHPGVAALYTRTGARVVPVALNSGMFWGRKSFMKYPGRITMEFLPAVKPGGDRETFLRDLMAGIDRRSRALCEEARAEFGLVHVALSPSHETETKTRSRFPGFRE